MSLGLPLTQAAAVADAVLVVARDATIVHAEGSALPLHGYEPARLIGRRIEDCLSGGALEALVPRYHAALAGEPQSFDYWSQDGLSAYWIRISPVRDRANEVRSVIGTVHDITERMRNEAALQRSERRLREAERMIGIGSWELDLSSGTVTYSDGLARVVGLPSEGRIGFEEFLSLVDPGDRRRVQEAIDTVVATGHGSCEYRIRRADGARRILFAQGELARDEAGRPTFVHGASLDVTDEREAERDRLAAMSLFKEGFDAAPIGMALTDPTGTRYVRVNDALCRMLGRPREELVELSLDDVTHVEDRALNRRSREALACGGASAFSTEKRYTRPDGSVAWAEVHVAPVRRDDGTIEALFAQIIDIGERKERESRLERYVSDALWLARIREALDDRRFVLHQQPVIDLQTGTPVQRELLVRLEDEDGELVAPGVFLPIAERYGLISEIDRWVIREAVSLAATGEAVQFNLSAASIADPAVLRELEDALARTGADPRHVVVEVTETALMHQLEAGQAFARAIVGLGCELALDDFGTGYASLTYLKHLPARYLKIDIEFVRELCSSETDQRLVRGIVGMARQFQQTTIAEGIEDAAALGLLRELGVDRGQGYLLGRPAPIPGERRSPPHRVEAGERFDGVATVKAAFEALETRDPSAVCAVCAEDVELRARMTAERAGHEEPYRGHAGVRAYLRDLAAAWDELMVTPSSFWQTPNGVIVFGRVTARAGGEPRALDVLWIFRLRDGRVAGVDVFRLPDPPTRRAHGPAWPLTGA